MKKIALLAATCLFSAAATFAQGVHTTTTTTSTDRTKAGEVIHDAKEGTEHAAQATGHAVDKGAHKAGHAVKKGAKATGHAVKKGAKKTGHAVSKGAKAVKNKAEDIVD